MSVDISKIAAQHAISPHFVGEAGVAIGRRYAWSACVHDDQIERVAIGRDIACDIILLDPELSRVHAHVLDTPDGVFLVDNGSKNGTRVGGVWVTPHERVVLIHDVRVELGECALRFFDPRVFEVGMASLAHKPPSPVSVDRRIGASIVGQGLALGIAMCASILLVALLVQ